MKRLTVEVLKGLPVHGQAVEIVERKGVGHPDYICDAVMESISVALSREYLKHFGTVLHHNVDKGLLVAGSVEKFFGGGRVLKPMEFIIGDRATFKADNVKIPVKDIAAAALYEWFKKNLPNVNPQKDVLARVVLQPGSEELKDIFSRPGALRAANDTSAAVGYAPMSITEKAVFETERFINSPAFKKIFPETGSDVKVMGVRRGRALDVTLACPLSARLIKSERQYFECKGRVTRAVRDFLADLPFSAVTLNYNTLDRTGAGEKGAYLTLLGTSAEDADSGQVGRGNRVNGVISLNRPMGTEAAAGKNPVSHVGKIYSILANNMAGEIHRRIDGIEEVYVWLLSQIGSPIDRPNEVYVRIIPAKGFTMKEAEKRASAVVEEFLSEIGVLTAELSRGEHPIC
ncbi:MAG: methionine adenosyltransferase [Thermodesulfobacteriota bacterium]